MESMDNWGGAFAPFQKHRDYLHSSAAEHLKAQQGVQSLRDLMDDEPVELDRDPITMIAMDPPGKFYPLHLNLETQGKDKEYIYLIPAAPGGGKPDEDSTIKSLERYIKIKSDEISQERQDLIDEIGDREEELQ